jgi:hypothetical protein
MHAKSKLIKMLVRQQKRRYHLAKLQADMRITLTLNLLTTTVVAPPSNASKWQMGFNSAFKVLIYNLNTTSCKINYGGS